MSTFLLLIGSFTSGRRIVVVFMIVAVAGFLALASTLLGTWASFLAAAPLRTVQTDDDPPRQVSD